MSEFYTNKETKLAFEFLQHTDKNIFLTGRAGTGKTTFLKSLDKTLKKRFVILAPTGVAALNAGGVTIHSFFQLPFHCIPPHSKFEVRKYFKSKIKIIRSLDLIVIDEISMVRCDILDAIDVILRRFRGSNKPFGGVQLLMIGDLNQLPPITNEQEELMLKPYYNSFYFFSSRALLQSNYITITLQHIYRQLDEEFIKILNHVRSNNVSQEDILTLNKRYQKDILDNIPSNHIVLCSHNNRADRINTEKINQLKEEEKIYEATMEGVFPETSFPNLERLHLKVGAQVMFLVNDHEFPKRYYNGKIGVVTHLEDNEVKVKCPEDEEEIIVVPYTWKNLEYSLDKKSSQIIIKEKGTFTQLPLKLAWAITIHKSQGLTFENAIIDSNRAFSHGQVYVALSRCRSLEGIILSEPFSCSSIILDNEVKDFNTKTLSSQPNNNQLLLEKQNYFIKVLYSVFDFYELNVAINELNKLCSTSLYKVFIQFSQNTINKIKTYKEDIEQVALKFQKFIIHTYNKEISYQEKKTIILHRVYKAKQYFLEHLLPLNEIILSLVDLELDNKEENQKLNEVTISLSVAKEVKVRYLNFIKEDEFSVSDFLQYRSAILAKDNEIELDSIAGKTNSYKKENKKDKTHIPEDVQNVKLYTSLVNWRKEIAKQNNIPAYMVISQVGIIGIANKKPQNIKELLTIKGIGEKKADLYGQEIISLINEIEIE